MEPVSPVEKIPETPTGARRAGRGPAPAEWSANCSKRFKTWPGKKKGRAGCKACRTVLCKYLVKANEGAKSARDSV